MFRIQWESYELLLNLYWNRSCQHPIMFNNNLCSKMENIELCCQKSKWMEKKKKHFSFNFKKVLNCMLEKSFLHETEALLFKAFNLSCRELRDSQQVLKPFSFNFLMFSLKGFPLICTLICVKYDERMYLNLLWEIVKPQHRCLNSFVE